MKVIIQMTEKEFDDLMWNRKFKSRKDMAEYLEAKLLGEDAIGSVDAIQITDDEHYRCSVYVKGDKLLG